MASATDSSTPVATCHCGRVSLALPFKPTKLNECQCSLCYRYGALWAYYPKAEVAITEREGPSSPPAQEGQETTAIRQYMRSDLKRAPGIAFCFCNGCGCLTHWSGLGKHAGKVGVNARMLEVGVMEGVAREISYC